MIYNNDKAILITTYNGDEFIIDCLSKIVESIKFTEERFPVFIFDDFSNDKTIILINEFINMNSDQEIFLHKSERNLGLFQNKNKAINILKLSYKWVFIMHQDDYPEKNWLYELNLKIRNIASQNVFVIWSSYNNLNNNIKLHGVNIGEDEIFMPSDLVINSWVEKIYTPYSISGSVINVELFKETKFVFDENYKHFGDTCFIADNMRRGYAHIYIPKSLITRRTSIHQASEKHFKNSIDIREFSHYFRTRGQYLKNKNNLYLSLIKFSINRLFRQLYYFNFKGFLLNFRYLIKLIFS